MYAKEDMIKALKFMFSEMYHKTLEEDQLEIYWYEKPPTLIYGPGRLYAHIKRDDPTGVPYRLFIIDLLTEEGLERLKTYGATMYGSTKFYQYYSSFFVNVHLLSMRDSTDAV